MNKSIHWFAGLLLFATRLIGNAQTVYSNQPVPAQAEIFGAGNAGLPDGAGLAPPEFDLPANPGVLTMLSATGTITLNNGGGSNDVDGIIFTGGYSGPSLDGQTGYSVANAYGGISGITIPGAGALVGVFAPAAAPSGEAPASLDFTVISNNFASFSPQLYQTFYIGDGLTGDGSGTVQQFIVPAGATRLFLGISDAPGFYGDPGAYGDNSGNFTVSFQISTAGLQLYPPFNSGTNFVLNFQSTTNQNYLVESSTNLAGGKWVTNLLWSGDGSYKQISVPMTNAARFFRIAQP